jgi:hypothetical protein
MSDVSIAWFSGEERMMSARALRDCQNSKSARARATRFPLQMSTYLSLEYRRSIAGEGHLDQAACQSRLEQCLLVLTPTASTGATDEHAHDRDDESGVDDFLL